MSNNIWLATTNSVCQMCQMIRSIFNEDFNLTSISKNISK